jgi:hypothetical protein
MWTERRETNCMISTVLCNHVQIYNVKRRERTHVAKNEGLLYDWYPSMESYMLGNELGFLPPICVLTGLRVWGEGAGTFFKT